MRELKRLSFFSPIQYILEAYSDLCAYMYWALIQTCALICTGRLFRPARLYLLGAYSDLGACEKYFFSNWGLFEHGRLFES